ncbi:hypothetical protein ACFLS9_01805 [Bacteroidota bacterium]
MNKRIKLLKKWGPGIFLVVLTISLMILFRLNKQGLGSLQNTGNDILTSYAKSLFPLYYKTDISNEDVFNFALYKNIPIDKEVNKVLQLDTDKYGNENFTVQELPINRSTENYNEYIFGMKFNPHEKQKFDSLLNVYREDLYASILIDNDNNIAIDPNLELIHKAISSDIYEFSRSKAENKSLFPKRERVIVTSKNELFDLLDKQREKKINEFIFITPDTVFNNNCEFDQVRVREDYRDYSKGRRPIQFAKGHEEVGILKTLSLPVKKQFDILNFEIDSNFYKVVFPGVRYPYNESFPGDSLNFHLSYLEDKINNISIALEIDEQKVEMDIETDSLTDNHLPYTFSFEFNLSSIDSIIKSSERFISQKGINDWVEFGIKIDSMAKSLQVLAYDSTMNNKIKSLMELKKIKIIEEDVDGEDSTSN